MHKNAWKSIKMHKNAQNVLKCTKNALKSTKKHKMQNGEKTPLKNPTNHQSYLII